MAEIMNSMHLLFRETKNHITGFRHCSDRDLLCHHLGSDTLGASERGLADGASLGLGSVFFPRPNRRGLDDFCNRLNSRLIRRLGDDNGRAGNTAAC